MMNVQARKLEIIERVLLLATEDALTAVEQALDEAEPALPGEAEIPAMLPRGKDEMTIRLAQARADARAGRTLTTEEMLARTKAQQAA